MEGETKERWFQLAQLAAVEQDPEKLIVLVQEINRLLDEKEERLNQRRRGAGPIQPTSRDRAGDPTCRRSGRDLLTALRHPVRPPVSSARFR